MKTVLIVYLILINLIGFFAMGIDKRRAIRHKWRISERTLFLLALLFGSIGVLTGMYVFRHKTKHLSFSIGIPAILVVQLLLLTLLYSWNLRRIQSPSQAVEHELALIRELDESTIQSFISYENLTNSHLASGTIDQKATDAVALFFKNFSYDILKESIDGETATVTVKITNSDMHAVAQDLCAAILRQSAAVIPSDLTQTTGDYYHLLYDTLASNSYDKTVTTAVFHLKKNGKSWMILADDTLEDELVSGFISSMNDPYILSASTVLSTHLDALKSLDAEGWKNYLSISDVFATYNSEYSTQIDDAYSARIAASFDYEILKCHETGDTATATVRITSVDMPDVLEAYKKYLLAYAATTRSIRDNDIQVSNETSRLLLQSLTETTSVGHTDVDMVFQNNGEAWEINFDDVFTNAVMGDLQQAMDTFTALSDEGTEESASS